MRMLNLLRFLILRQHCLGIGSLVRRRPSEEGEYKKALRAYRLQGSRYPRHDADGARQRLTDGWLNDKMGDVAKRAVGLNGWTVCVCVPGLHNPAEGDQCAAKKAEHHP